MKRRAVYFLTRNARKLDEYRVQLRRYDVDVVGVAENPSPARIAELLDSGTDALRVVAVLREETALQRRGTRERARLRDLERVDHHATLTAWFRRAGSAQTETRTYDWTTPGHLDFSRRAQDPASVFGWDDVFVLRRTLRTYEELRHRGLKVSSRDMVLSDFIRDFLHYENRIDLRFAPQRQQRTVDFARDPRELVAASPHLNTPTARRYGLANAFAHVLESGVFFRSAVNRREKNYWLPGLNAGIPFTPKRDAVHEATYLVHDLCHFVIPDPVVITPGGEGSRRAYIAARMMSEAVTLVLADMLFADALVRDGAAYDFAPRRIHPLFRALSVPFGEDALDEGALRALLYANARYCLLGDDGAYRALLARGGAGDEPLRAFEEKYAPFFVEDFRWTERNYDDMANRADVLARWWSATERLRALDDLGIETLPELESALAREPGENLFERVFARMYRTRVLPALTASPSPPDKARRLRRAFLRWALGQCAIFERFDFVPEARTYRDRFVGFIAENYVRLDTGMIDDARSFYEEFLDVLVEKSVIALDDARTFAEVHPLFEPFFVFYDEDKGRYEGLAKVSNRLLGARGGDERA